MDLAVGEFDEISSAEVDGFTEALVRALPGLKDHHCSIGSRGGFVIRLRRGTYAPHIIEHVALELQTMIGHDVGYGRTRGGDVDGEYTLIFEHLHEGVGMRAAALALETVQRAFAGVLTSVDHMVDELAAIAKTPDAPPVTQHVRCGITGGGDRAEARQALAARACCEHELLVDVSPAFVLQAGLPFARADVVVILDTHPTDVPERYQDPERARRLMAVMLDALPRGGVAVVPAREWELQDEARDGGCGVAVFSDADDIRRKDKKVARTAAWPADGRIVIEHRGQRSDAGALDPDLPVHAQVAAAVAAYTLDERARRDAERRLTPPDLETVRA
jgi:cyanophycin synthetase